MPNRIALPFEYQNSAPPVRLQAESPPATTVEVGSGTSAHHGTLSPTDDPSRFPLKAHLYPQAQLSATTRGPRQSSSAFHGPATVETASSTFARIASKTICPILFTLYSRLTEAAKAHMDVHGFRVDPADSIAYSDSFVFRVRRLCLWQTKHPQNQ